MLLTTFSGKNMTQIKAEVAEKGDLGIVAEVSF